MSESERIRRATPKPDRPRLPDHMEEKFAPVDEKSRQAYTKIEEALDDLDGLGAIPQAELDVTDTLVSTLRAPKHDR